MLQRQCGMLSFVATPSPWIVHCDGSAVPNPGQMGLGAVLVAPDGVRHTLSETPAGSGCNNEAELKALMAALRTARGHGATAVQVFTDNSVLVEQLGPAKVPPVARLAVLFDDARALIASFELCSVAWIPRRRNAEADALARAALGIAPKTAPKRFKKKRR